MFVGELAVRLLELAPRLEEPRGNYVADPPLPFMRRPGSLTRVRNEEFEVEYRHNGFGFRDVEHTLAKGKGTFRIVGLGDSFTYGVGVGFAETYLSRLEARLNGRAGVHPRVEIIKAGIPRYFPEPERMLLEKYGVRFQPDLILAGLAPNDVFDTFFGMDAVTIDRSGYLVTREAKQLGSLGLRLYSFSHLARLLLKRYVEWQIRRKYQPSRDEAFRSDGPHEKDWVKLESEYGRMAALADSIDARFLIVHIPPRGPWDATSRYPATRMAAWTRQHGVEFADVLPAMEREASPGRLYYPKDGHCTPAGHAVIADALFAYLTDRKLVP